MANYLFLKESSEPVKVGDLTQNGIHELICDHWNEVKLIPLLIMDAPEEPEEEWTGLSTAHQDDVSEEWDKYWDKIHALEKNAILFHSNEQVYNWLKSKGIKPEADLLIEFDGEVELIMERLPEMEKKNLNTAAKPYRREKVAIIKDTEVKQESELIEGLANELFNKYRLYYDGRSYLTKDLFTLALQDNLLKQHFKIERRK